MNQTPKTLLAAALVACAGVTAQAGESYVASSKTMQPPVVEVDLYNAHEWSVDIFGTYAFSESTNEQIFGDHAFGGGLGVNYFFTRCIGIGLEAQYLDTKSDGVASGALNVFYRYPMGHWAPYVYIGGGAIFNADNISRSEIADEFDKNDRNSNSTELEGHAGLGVEYRFTHNFGVFTDARWNVVEQSKNNFPSIRTGITFAF